MWDLDIAYVGNFMRYKMSSCAQGKLSHMRMSEKRNEMGGENLIRKNRTRNKLMTNPKSPPMSKSEIASKFKHLIFYKKKNKNKKKIDMQRSQSIYF